MFQISGKNLGALALEDACDRCFWIKTRIKWKAPFAPFPGIFSSIDSYTKNIVEDYLAKNNYALPWLKQLGPISGVLPGYSQSKFRLAFPELDATLTGSTDAMFQTPDGQLIIVDYKTARYTEGQDDLLPMYEAQLNAYARIAEEGLALGKVAKLALIYFEPLTKMENYAQYVKNDGFSLIFNPKIHEVEIKKDLVSNLLKRAVKINAQKTAPDASTECDDCAKMDVLLDLFK